MFLVSDNNHDLLFNMESIGLTKEITSKRDVLIKLIYQGRIQKICRRQT